MNVHVSVLEAELFDPVPDPMALAVANWRASRDRYNDSLSEDASAADERVWGIVEEHDADAVLAETATTVAGFDALLSFVSYTLGELDEGLVLAAIKCSMREICTLGLRR